MGAINPKEDYSNIQNLTFDAVIVGGGGSGMRASYQLAQAGLKVAVLTKVFPHVRILLLLKAVLVHR
jgi:succinate dehydrogenase / fumarate reductase flavoprotein subunit